MEKKLYRSKTNKMLCGVCGGVGEYINLDQTIVRLIAVILAFCSFGTAILVYFIMAVVMPDNPNQ